jgi:hypothetical protein
MIISYWNQLPGEALMLTRLNLRVLERELGSNYKRGEMKGIELWRKLSKIAVK